MRIGVISASQIPSRAANSIQVMKVCQAIMDLGHELQLWVPGSRPLESPDALKSWYGLQRTVPIHWITSVRALRRYDFAWKAVRQAQAWGADVVYCWPLQAATLSARRGMPTVLEVHDRPQGIFGPFLMNLFLQASGVRRLLPITKAMQEWLAKTYDAELQEPFSMVAPMGVDLEQFQDLLTPDDARKELELEGGFTVGYAGHLYEGRGVNLMAALAKRNPELQFLWIGGEPNAVERWRGRVAEEGIHNIELVGFVPNDRLPRYLAACEILLMPYERTIAGSSGGDTAQFASPMKAFEYMASGKAILASDLAVLREVLDEEVALLLPPEDVDAWDQALKRLLQNPLEVTRLGEAAKAQVKQSSWVARAERALAGLGNG